MTNHYIKTLGVAKCREILKGVPLGTTHATESSHLKENGYGVWLIWDGHWRSDFRWPEGELINLSDLHTELALHDTDSCTDIRNHVSPNTVVVG